MAVTTACKLMRPGESYVLVHSAADDRQGIVLRQELDVLV